MMTVYSEMGRTARQIEVATGQRKASLVLKNANIINVFTNDIVKGDIAIENGFICGIGTYNGYKEIELDGKYVCSGFIDGHIHLESSMVSPIEFEKAVMSHGTTSVITDPHEIANVAGHDGILYLLETTEQMAMDVFFMMPSCVPSTDLDESGATLNADDIEAYYEDKRVLGLAEMMNAYGVLQKDEKVLEKICDALRHGKLIDGHAPALHGRDLQAYIGSGISSDHECADINEAIEKIQYGQWIMIREGTAAKNLKALVSLCSEKYYHRCMFVTDDKHPGDLIEKGHMDYIIRKAVSMGADPIRAIKMASWNPAQYFQLNDRGAVAPGYRADLVVFDSMEHFNVIEVLKDGKPIKFSSDESENEKDARSDYKRVMNSFHMKEIFESDLSIPSDGKYERVIELIPKELLTKELIIQKYNEEGYPVGVSIKNDILKAAVFERHNNTNHIGIGFIKGYGLKCGAVASSVAHDSHNLIVIGTNDKDIAVAANCVRKNQGGIAIAVDGIVKGELPLPIAGLMSDLSVEDVENRLNNLKELTKSLGILHGIDPFMTLAFVSLPVIPELRLNTYGLINVRDQKIVKVFFDK